MGIKGNLRNERSNYYTTHKQKMQLFIIQS